MILNGKYVTDSEIANLSQFVQTELQYQEAEIYKIEYPELTYDKVIPVNSAASGVQQIAYDVYDRAGEAQLITSYSKDVPRATTGKIRKYRGIYEYGQGAAYTIQEVNSARFANLPLETRELEAARYGTEIRMNKLAYFGDKNISEDDFYGLFNNGQVGVLVNNVSDEFPVVTLKDGTTPATWEEALSETGATADDLASAAQRISQQINYVFAKINNRSLGVEVADTLLIPRLQYNLIATTVISTFTQETVLSRVIKNSPYLKSESDIIVVNELSYANAQKAADNNTSPFGTAATRTDVTGATISNANLQQDAMMALRRDPHKLKFWMATPFNFLQPQLVNFEFRINGYCSTGGHIMYYPLSALMAFGI